MSNRWYGRVIETGEMQSGLTSYKITPDSSIALKAVRTWVIKYSNPTMTNLKMRIYSNNAGSVGKLLHTSTNTYSLSQISTSDYAIREIYFEFNEIPLRSGDSYFFSLEADTYTGSDSAHIAWAVGLVDPAFSTDTAISMTHISRLPPYLSFIGAEL